MTVTLMQIHRLENFPGAGTKPEGRERKKIKSNTLRAVDQFTSYRKSFGNSVKVVRLPFLCSQKWQLDSGLHLGSDLNIISIKNQ
jgi:hypothetical protein